MGGYQGFADTQHSGWPAFLVGREKEREEKGKKGESVGWVGWGEGSDPRDEAPSFARSPQTSGKCSFTSKGGDDRPKKRSVNASLLVDGRLEGDGALVVEAAGAIIDNPAPL